MAVCVVVAAGALAFRIGMALAGASTIAVFVLTPSHLDALAIGGFLAAAARGPCRLDRLVRPWRLITAGSALLLACLFAARDETAASRWMQTIGFSALALLFGGVIVLATASPWARWFENPLLRALGKYSYALYLFNLPLRAVVRDEGFTPERIPAVLDSHLPGQIVFYVVATALSFAAAYLSWHLYEKHFLRLKRFFPEPRRTAAAVVHGPQCPA